FISRRRLRSARRRRIFSQNSFRVSFENRRKLTSARSRSAMLAQAAQVNNESSRRRFGSSIAKSLHAWRRRSSRVLEPEPFRSCEQLLPERFGILRSIFRFLFERVQHYFLELLWNCSHHFARR